MGPTRRDHPFGMYGERLASAVHESYRRLCREEGRPVPPEADREYAALSDDLKAANMAAAARIPRVLALAGLEVVPGDHPSTLSRAEVEVVLDGDMERLAEAEHDGWMEQKHRDGWTYSPVRDDEAKRHPCLVPYGELSEEDKEKDRHAVKGYTDIVELAGYGIVRAGSPTQPG